MYELRRLDIRSTARIAASVSVVCHLLAGIAAAIVYLGVRSYVANSFLATGMGALTLLLFWLALSLVVMACAAVIGALVALLYNLFASWWGGIRVELGAVGAQPSAAGSQQSAENGKQGMGEGKKPAENNQRAVPGTDQHADRQRPKAESPQQPTRPEKTASS